MPRRIVDIPDGLTMVVSDLHGDRDAFARHVGRFLQYRSRGRVQRLLLLGDLIHSDGPESEDASLQLITDVMRMQATLGTDNVMMLLGNHELPHLYGFVLWKGNFEFTPRFEKALTASGRRAEIIAFLEGLPFYARTAAGVSFAHAGADGTALAQFGQLVELDHQAIRDEYDHVLSLHPKLDELREMYASTVGIRLPYEILVRHALAVESRDDPRYNDLLRSHMILEKSSEFNVLWDALFTRGEKRSPLALYQRILDRFLGALSTLNAPAPQTVLVSGHIDLIGGHQIVTPHQLRIASARHATPREAGQYLLFDAAKPIASAEDLVPLLGSVYLGA